jgi:hypothetical protein
MAAIGDLDVIYPMGFSADRDQYLHRSKPLFSLNDLWVYK